MHISEQRLPGRPSIEVHPDALQRRPHLAMLVGLIIATWADIEGRLEAVFLLCVRDSAALADLRSIKGWEDRSKFFAQKVQDLHGYSLAIEVRAILRFVALPAKKRHDIAHGVWALCKELPNDLVIAGPEIYTNPMAEALRAEAEGTQNFVINKNKMVETARVITVEHLTNLLVELGGARNVLHHFMIEKTPAIVHVRNREALPRAADHPNIADRIRNAEKGLKARDKRLRMRERSCANGNS